MNIPYQTLAKYETQTTPLKVDVLEKAGKFYGVSVPEVAIDETESAREDAPPYRVQALALEIIPTPLLQDIIKVLSSLVPLRQGTERGKIMHGLMAATQELDSRGAAHHTASSQGVSAEETAAVASVSAEADRLLAESSTPFPTGARKKDAGESSSRSYSTSKTPHPGTPKPGKA